MEKRLVIFIGIVLSISLLGACKKDKPPVRPPNDNTLLGDTTAYKILVSNEGLYNYGNASLSLFNVTQQKVNNQLFQQANTIPLGDVLQSVKKINGKYYLVVNNSGKVLVCNATDFKVEKTISGFNSPRYIQEVSSTKAYVTDLYANKIWILDLVQNSITGSINCNGWTETMCLLGNNLYVTNYYRNYVYILNTQTDLITDSIPVSLGGSSILSDNSGLLWIMCSGNEQENVKAALYKIDPVVKQVITRYTFSTLTEHPGSLCMVGNNLYYLNNGLWRLEANGTILQPQKILEKGNKVFYGLSEDANRNKLWLCNARDYVNTGQVLGYDLNSGKLTDSAEVGIIPNSCLVLD